MAADSQGRGLLSEIGRATKPGGGLYLCVSLLQARPAGPAPPGLALRRPIPPAWTTDLRASMGSLEQEQVLDELLFSLNSGWQARLTCSVHHCAVVTRKRWLKRPCSSQPADRSSVFRVFATRTQVSIYQVPPAMDMLTSPLQPFLVVCEALPDATAGAPQAPRPVKCHFTAAQCSRAVNAEQVRPPPRRGIAVGCLRTAAPGSSLMSS